MVSMTKMVDGLEFDSRLIQARSWWLASTLARRNEDLVLLLFHHGADHNDNLGLHSFRANQIVIDINRNGSIHAFPPNGEPRKFGWAEVFSSEPFQTVRRLELVLGNQGFGASRKTDRRLLTYRLMAAIAEVGSLAKYPWVIRSAYYDSDAGGSKPVVSVFDDFPSAATEHASVGPHPLGDPAHGFWVFCRKNVAEFVVSERGHLHSKSGPPVDLFEQYQKAGRNLWQLVGTAFGTFILG